jgi:hypothetical protein
MRRVAAFLVLAALLPGCGSDASDPTATSPGGGSLQLIVEPAVFWQVTPGQVVVVLASATGGEGEVTISAALTGDASLDPDRVSIEPGAVAEFTIVPGRAAPDPTWIWP